MCSFPSAAKPPSVSLSSTGVCREVLIHSQPFHCQTNAKVLVTMEKQRSVLLPQFKNDLADSIYLSVNYLALNHSLTGKSKWLYFIIW